MNSFVSINFSLDWGLKMKRQHIIFLAFIFCIASIDKSDSAPTKDTLEIPPQGVDVEQNVLQKHVTFFDRNKDGVIYPWETFEGFRAIGCGYLLSSVAAIFINAGLSGKTRPGKFPSLLFPIEVGNIQKAKHGSDSGVYDSEGRFVPSKFEEIFSKHARANANTLTGDELMGLLKANRVPKDYGGWLASYTEWKILYVLCKDKNGLLHIDTIRAVYDGSLFEQMAKKKASAGKRNVASA